CRRGSAQYQREGPRFIINGALPCCFHRAYSGRLLVAVEGRERGDRAEIGRLKAGLDERMQPSSTELSRNHGAKKRRARKRDRITGTADEPKRTRSPAPLRDSAVIAVSRRRRGKRFAVRCDRGEQRLAGIGG